MLLVEKNALHGKKSAPPAGWLLGSSHDQQVFGMSLGLAMYRTNISDGCSPLTHSHLFYSYPPYP
jgi:hypothetical protein